MNGMKNKLVFAVLAAIFALLSLSVTSAYNAKYYDYYDSYSGKYVRADYGLWDGDRNTFTSNYKESSTNVDIYGNTIKTTLTRRVTNDDNYYQPSNYVYHSPSQPQHYSGIIYDSKRYYRSSEGVLIYTPYKADNFRSVKIYDYDSHSYYYRPINQPDWHQSTYSWR